MESTVKHARAVNRSAEIVMCPSPDGVDCQALRDFYNTYIGDMCPSPDGVDCQAPQTGWGAQAPMSVRLLMESTVKHLLVKFLSLKISYLVSVS